MKTLIRISFISVIVVMIMIFTSIATLQFMGVPVLRVVDYSIEQQIAQQTIQDTTYKPIIAVDSKYKEKWEAYDRKLVEYRKKSVEQAIKDNKSIDLPPIDESVYESREYESIDLPIDSTEVCFH